MSTPVPFPLPDLPRAPSSDLSRLACRILEHRDLEALTRLPDMLTDLSRAEDAKYIREQLAVAMWERRFDRQSLMGSGVSAFALNLWSMFLSDLAEILWWDIFDWSACLAIIGRQLSPAPIPPISGTGGTVTIGDQTLPIVSWSVPPPSATTHDLHANEAHPDFEYTTSSGPFNHPNGGGWERNLACEEEHNLEYHWMRRRT